MTKAVEADVVDTSKQAPRRFTFGLAHTDIVLTE